MKLKFIYTLLSIVFMAFMLLSHSGGRAADQGNGNTGAPGDQTTDTGDLLTCVNCHNNNADLQVTLDIDVLDANNESIASDGYTPGETYTVKVLINPAVGTPAGHGFQLSCLNAPEGMNGSEVATWTDIADNVKIATAAANGRTYAEHDGVSTSNEFLVEWTAPAAGSGEVTFYSCGNGVNLNGNRTGDGADCSTLELAEAGASSVGDLDIETVQLNVFPNPVKENLTLDIESKLTGNYTMNIIDQVGRTVQSERVQLFTGENILSFDVAHLAKGHYFVQLVDKQQTISAKMLKL